MLILPKKGNFRFSKKVCFEKDRAAVVVPPITAVFNIMELYLPKKWFRKYDNKSDEELIADAEGYWKALAGSVDSNKPFNTGVVKEKDIYINKRIQGKLNLIKVRDMWPEFHDDKHRKVIESAEY